MPKTVAVVDEYDNVYEATYPARAKGLVKKGRARFIGQNKICLACPPVFLLEDTKMSENITDKITDEMLTDDLPSGATFAQEDFAQSGTAAEYQANTEQEQEQEYDHADKAEYTIEYLLAQISELSARSRSSAYAISQIADKETDADKAQALACAVSAREETNRKLIDLYEKMYNDLRPKDFSVMYKALDLIERTVNNPNCTVEQKASLVDMLTAVGKLEF